MTKFNKKIFVITWYLKKLSNEYNILSIINSKCNNKNKIFKLNFNFFY